MKKYFVVFLFLGIIWILIAGLSWFHGTVQGMAKHNQEIISASGSH